MQRQRLAGEKAGDHQRQRSVLGAADGYGAGQALAADNADAVHGVLLPRARPAAEPRPIPRLPPQPASKPLARLPFPLQPCPPSFAGLERGLRRARASALRFNRLARSAWSSLARRASPCPPCGRFPCCPACWPSPRHAPGPCAFYTKALAWRRRRQALRRASPMAGSRRTLRGSILSGLRRLAAHRSQTWSTSRRSSVVEHVIGNDGVGSSILPGGTSFPENLA